MRTTTNSAGAVAADPEPTPAEAAAIRRLENQRLRAAERVERAYDALLHEIQEELATNRDLDALAAAADLQRFFPKFEAKGLRKAQRAA